MITLFFSVFVCCMNADVPYFSVSVIGVLTVAENSRV